MKLMSVMLRLELLSASVLKLMSLKTLSTVNVKAAAVDLGTDVIKNETK